MGWFKTWDEEWLNDEVLNAIGLENQGAFVRVKCLANICLNDGKMVLHGIPLEKQQIIAKCNIEERHFNYLEKHGLITMNNGCWSISGYKKWQSEYSRQKGYRQGLQHMVTSKGTREEVRKKK